MTDPYSFPRYLAAKTSVDDRALNWQVWQRLAQEMHQDLGGGPVSVLEMGAGTGTMIRRLVERKLFRHCEYYAFDAEPENTAAALQGLQAWAAAEKYPAERAGERLIIHLPDGWLDVRFETCDLEKFLYTWSGKKTWDLVIANAFLDLIDLPRVLPHLLDLAVPGGLFAFTINFDGLTLFEPQIDAQFDEQVLALYHRSMDERQVNGQPAGDSRTGRHLFTNLAQAGFEILEAGSSDWVVFPRGGSYPGDEAYFLHFILHFFEETLRGHPELDAERFAAWLEQRRAQINRAELVYIAHQLDFLARRPLP